VRGFQKEIQLPEENHPFYSWKIYHSSASPVLQASTVTLMSLDSRLSKKDHK